MSFISNLLKEIFPRKLPHPTDAPQHTTLETDRELLREAEERKRKERAEEATYLKIAPQKNTNPHSFGYIPNPFRDTQQVTASSKVAPLPQGTFPPQYADHPTD